jgi:hypothetical protein
MSQAGGTTQEDRDVARKKVVLEEPAKAIVVNYSIGREIYQIDTDRHKVYRRFVEIETAKASTIYASWRASARTDLHG